MSSAPTTSQLCGVGSRAAPNPVLDPGAHDLRTPAGTRRASCWSTGCAAPGFSTTWCAIWWGRLFWPARTGSTREAIPTLLAARNRSAAGPTAPASGLFLVNVEYPTRR